MPCLCVGSQLKSYLFTHPSDPMCRVDNVTYAAAKWLCAKVKLVASAVLGASVRAARFAWAVLQGMLHHRTRHD